MLYKQRRKKNERATVSGDLVDQFREFRRVHPELGEVEALARFLENCKREAPDQAATVRFQATGAPGGHATVGVGASQHRCVERYLGFPIGEELRASFEQWLNAHPEVSEEEAAAQLLNQGLQSDNAPVQGASGTSVQVPLPEPLRQKLARVLPRFLDSMSEENVYAMLLDMGLDKAEEQHRLLTEWQRKRAARERRLARQARLRALCSG